MTGRRAAPVRTCVGCRERVAAAELLRVVAVGELGSYRAVPDPRRQLAGRGASVHPRLACVALAERRRAFPRVLRVAGPIDLSAVREHVAGGAAATVAEHAPEHPGRSRSDAPG